MNRVEQRQLLEAVACLQQWNRQYQFAPVYTLQDMLGQSSLLPCFSWEDLYVYREQGKVMGTLGIWDQQAFKQTVVVAYSRKMQLIRPFYNVLAYVQENPPLPAAGAHINILYAAFVSGSKDVFASLLKQVCTEWSGKGYDYLSVGFCEGNELATVAARYATQHIASTVYIVYWQNDGVVLPEMSRPVHVEIATL